MDPALASLVDVLSPEESSPGHFQATSVAIGGLENVFGGQLLAQMVACTARTVPDMSVKSLQAIFVRGAAVAQPLAIDVEVHHRGRLYASATVSISQDDRLHARALVLLDRPDVELARHAQPMPDVDPPSAGASMRSMGGGIELQLLGGVDLNDPDVTGPPEVQIWARFPGAPADDALRRALLAYATEPHLFSTALRPHAGLGLASVYVKIVPAVITHSVIFHEAVDVSDWFLLDLESPYTGRGRIYGHGSVYARDGTLVASVDQQNQLRPL